MCSDLWIAVVHVDGFLHGGRQSHPKDFTLGTSRHPTRATLLAMSSTVAISGSLQKLSLAIAVPALMDQVDPILQFDEDAASSWRGGQPALPGELISRTLDFRLKVAKKPGNLVAKYCQKQRW
ncbi:unnamed protein product [Durusdinium trenchii]|uniref:Uncharacterized protein n=1 Tax=Durusdinium trenchii TaxID=1381693 RepID=A0ABP0QCL0_9DINO